MEDRHLRKLVELVNFPYDLTCHTVVDWLRSVRDEADRQGLTPCLDDDRVTRTPGYKVGRVTFRVSVTAIKARVGWPSGLSASQMNTFNLYLSTGVGRKTLLDTGYYREVLAIHESSKG